ncbi:Tripartite Motif-Containing Protein 15 [Manis pentadactyla]|nr:Tripartite Motif-Containing Protein 15 [Manis pentadactyla]
MLSTSSHEGATCPAFKGPLKDAVTATCGHTFCQLCLLPPSQMGAQPSARVLLCPLCKEKEQKETLMVPVPLGPLGETYCEEHGEKIYFFCENDAEFLCVFCREGPTHQAHTVGFLDEAIQPYRDCLRSWMGALSMERDEIEDIKSQEDQKLQMLLTQIESKKQQVEAAFEKLQQELEEQQCLLLDTLPLGVPGHHNKSQNKVFLFVLPSDNLAHHLEPDSGVLVLDPQTASRSLVLSKDRKSVTYTRQKQDLLDSPLRFEGLPVVLGSPGFSSGRHCWQVEVQLGAGGGCTVGVAAEEVRRKEEQGLGADKGVWAVIISHQQCWASTSPGTDVRLSDIPRRVGVALDYEAGRVTLRNFETQAPIFTFTASFSGKVFPFFAVWKIDSRLTLLG